MKKAKETRNAAIEVQAYPTDYFRAGDPFIEEIKKDGILIFGKENAVEK